MTTPEYKQVVLDRLSTGWHNDDIPAEMSPPVERGQRLQRARVETMRQVRRATLLVRAIAAVGAASIVWLTLRYCYPPLVGYFGPAGAFLMAMAVDLCALLLFVLVATTRSRAS